jgi:competence protein ComEC
MMHLLSQQWFFTTPTNWWQRAPFLRLLLPFVAGIVLQTVVAVAFMYTAIAGISVLLLLVAFLLSPHYWQLRWFMLKGFLVHLFLLLLGMFVMGYQEHQQRPAVSLSAGVQNLVIQLNEPLIERNQTYKSVAQIQTAELQGKAVEAGGQMILYFKKDSTLLRLLPQLNAGTQCVVQCNLQPIRNSGNPGAFDYEAWCHQKGIYYQAFINGKAIRPIQQTTTMGLPQMLWTIRLKILYLLYHYIPNKQSQSIASALLMGYRSDLDRELVQAYSNVGVVHIIAISGLHMGMVYGLLFFLLSPLENRKQWRVLKYIGLLLGIWSFALIAGGAPSVSRSAVMFSFIVLGQWQQKEASVYNNLAASAMLLLLYNPYNLWEVGFQLSYAAVVGIIAFQSPIQTWLLQWIPYKKIVTLISVTLAAQVFTTPISAYHFHQFPLYFLIANIWVVPYTAVLLYGLLLLLPLTIWPMLAVWWGSMVSKGIDVLNAGVLAINAWPHAVWKNIYLTSGQMVLLLLALLLLIYAFSFHKKTPIYLSLLAIGLFVGMRTIDYWQKNNQRKLIVYQVPQATAIDFIAGSDCKFLGNAAYFSDGYLRNFHLQPSRIVHRVQNVEVVDTTLQAPLSLHFQKHRIVWLNHLRAMQQFSFTTPPAVVILSQNVAYSLAELGKLWPNSFFVADGSNALWKINEWKKEAEVLHLRLHSVPDSGAFVMNL